MDSELQKILNDINVLDKLCDAVRLVDPLGKGVIDHSFDGAEFSGVRCFDNWGRSKVCENCISMRAFNDDTTYVKIEYTDDRTFMVTAVPYVLNGRKVVVEILKDITSSLSLIAGESAGSVKNEIHAMIDNMNSLALKDSLTGIYNRRYISEKLPVDLLSAAMNSHDLSIIMADIDYFKKVNDTYGHLVGDCALKSVARLLTSCLQRGSDWMARFGGEEFLVCLPGASAAKAAEIAEQMRLAVEANDIVCDNTRFRITASFGVGTVLPRQSESVEQLISLADEKLYRAKKNGRNRVEA